MDYLSVDYAAAVVFEVRKSPTVGPVLRFKFKNGTSDDTFHTYNLKFPGWNKPGDVPLSTFISAFAPAAINTTTEWCNICGQTTLRGCADLKGVPGPATASFLEAAAYTSPSPATEDMCTAPHERIGPLGAGFMGAGLTLALVTIVLATLTLLGLFSFGNKKSKRPSLKADEVVADLRSGVSGSSLRVSTC